MILSDVHLGTYDCKVEEVNYFLQHTNCGKLVLNGDIIDGWSLARKGRWTDSHTRFIRLALTKIEKRGTEVIYLRGNHDDILNRFLPIFFGKLTIENEHIHKGVNGDYMIVHGDGFDAVTLNYRWLALLGDIGYKSLLRINRVYNKYRSWRGKPFFSLSKAIKARVKSAVSYVGKYEEQLKHFARKNNCIGIICGHIHTPDDKMIEGIHYLNSGDWVESLTALVEHEDGRFEVLGYDDFCARLEAGEAKRTGEENKSDEEPGPDGKVEESASRAAPPTPK
ncbi:MAG: UDP-2,3-diacylglucosamine diphosphatase [Opitutales bacterium]